MPTEVEAFKALMASMEAEMVKIVPATPAMMTGTLLEALQSEPLAVPPTPPLGQRRCMVLSGMYGSEVVEVISAYHEAGTPAIRLPGRVATRCKWL